jgi:hypothetical protein
VGAGKSQEKPTRDPSKSQGKPRKANESQGFFESWLFRRAGLDLAVGDRHRPPGIRQRSRRGVAIKVPEWTLPRVRC